MFYFDEFKKRTGRARSRVHTLCNRNKIEFEQIRLSSESPAENLRILKDRVDLQSQKTPILVDISTMPREVIWHLFWLCESTTIPLNYIYYSPAGYSSNWQSRNFERPRLIHKLSGIASPKLPTALVLTVGFDIQRVHQLVRFFEPSKLFIGLQTKSRFEQNTEKMRQYEDEFGTVDGRALFMIDAYGDDRGLGILRQQVKSMGVNYNILLGSLGPKLTSIPVFRIQRERQDIGLVYAPANEFNEKYSKGIGIDYQGSITTAGRVT